MCTCFELFLCYISLGGCFPSTLQTVDMLCAATLLIWLLKNTCNKYALVLKKALIS